MYALKILNFVLFNAMFSILIIIMKIGIKRHVFFFQKGVFIWFVIANFQFIWQILFFIQYNGTSFASKFFFFFFKITFFLISFFLSFRCNSASFTNHLISKSTCFFLCSINERINFRLIPLKQWKDNFEINCWRPI